MSEPEPRDIAVDLPDPLTYQEGNGEETIDVPLETFVAKLSALLDSVPEEHRSRAYLRIWGSGDYAKVYLSAFYSRPETSQEVADRLSQEVVRKAQTARESEERERALFDRLKAKYETRD